MNNAIQLETALCSRPWGTGTVGTRSAEVLPLNQCRRKPRVITQVTHTRGALAIATPTTDAPLTVSDICDALNEGRIEMHYQPQYDMLNRQTVAAEALVRLIDVDGQLVYPDRFIEMVEQSDLIVPLGRAVIEQVCADLATCRAEGFALQRIAINLSANQLNIDTTLLGFIDQMVALYGLSYHDLEFELTERQSLTPNCEGIALLNALAERGSRIVIDDFGIGYSSMVYLTKLPISAFKLDPALVSRLPEDKTMQCVVNSLLALAANLDLDVVAEGIETTEQNQYLTRAGCPFAQGFGYAKPMVVSDLCSFLTEATSRYSLIERD